MATDTVKWSKELYHINGRDSNSEAPSYATMFSCYTHQSWKRLSEAVKNALATEDFAAAMAALATLRRPLDAFFDKVTVNADEPALRVNRLRLLALIVSAMGRLADFSKVEG